MRYGRHVLQLVSIIVTIERNPPDNLPDIRPEHVTSVTLSLRQMKIFGHPPKADVWYLPRHELSALSERSHLTSLLDPQSNKQ
jgi:hypothetical protein